MASTNDRVDKYAVIRASGGDDISHKRYFETMKEAMEIAEIEAEKNPNIELAVVKIIDICSSNPVKWYKKDSLLIRVGLDDN